MIFHLWSLICEGNWSYMPIQYYAIQYNTGQYNLIQFFLNEFLIVVPTFGGRGGGSIKVWTKAILWYFFFFEPFSYKYLCNSSHITHSQILSGDCEGGHLAWDESYYVTVSLLSIISRNSVPHIDRNVYSFIINCRLASRCIP